MTQNTSRVGNMKFTKSANGVTIEFEDGSHEPVQISENQWQQVNSELGLSGSSSGGSYSGSR